MLGIGLNLLSTNCTNVQKYDISEKGMQVNDKVWSILKLSNCISVLVLHVKINKSSKGINVVHQFHNERHSTIHCY